LITKRYTKPNQKMKVFLVTCLIIGVAQATLPGSGRGSDNGGGGSNILGQVFGVKMSLLRFLRDSLNTQNGQNEVDLSTNGEEVDGAGSGVAGVGSDGSGSAGTSNGESGYGYSAPAQQGYGYAAPAQQQGYSYDPPVVNPQPSYGTPLQVAPAQNYPLPQPSYGPPQQSYGPPAQAVAPVENSYLPPSPPSNTYLPAAGSGSAGSGSASGSSSTSETEAESNSGSGGSGFDIGSLVRYVHAIFKSNHKHVKTLISH
jgi:hypothetical protein